MENCKISIIVPFYNAESYLRQCIDSILCQTVKSLELILVDDGSIDGSVKICDEFSKKDQRVRMIQTGHEGPGKARNTAHHSILSELFIRSLRPIFLTKSSVAPT
ncbi:MAG TPA: glycosyltransferase family 2 protein [Clostridia bacterium]|nr:glycosyltransferase family 2 protein [Clostridia bacterium]